MHSVAGDLLDRIRSDRLEFRRLNNQMLLASIFSEDNGSFASNTSVCLPLVVRTLICCHVLTLLYPFLVTHRFIPHLLAFIRPLLRIAPLRLQKDGRATFLRE